MFVTALSLASCAAAPADEDAESSEHHWDSADGNPTHATHSYMAEHAIKRIKGELHEVSEYKDQIVVGANLELHELPVKNDPEHDALRREIGGNNWAADHPEMLWDKARASYASGDKAQAFVYVGILLHYVQDMGVPAHAFHVIHQGSMGKWDHLELLGFFDYHADERAPAPADPGLDGPAAYIEWSASTARDHFTSAFPGATYHRKFFPSAYDNMTDAHWAFLRKREADCMWATTFALRAAARGLAASVAPSP